MNNNYDNVYTHCIACYGEFKRKSLIPYCSRCIHRKLLRCRHVNKNDKQCYYRCLNSFCYFHKVDDFYLSDYIYIE